MIVERLPLKNSISTKLFRMVFSIYCVVTLALTGIQMLTEYNHVKEKVLGELQLLATTVEPGLSKSLWDVDIAQLQTTIDVLGNLPIITGVQIEDENANLMAFSGSELTKDNNQTAPFERPSLAMRASSVQLFQYEFDIVYSKKNRKVGKGIFYSGRDVVLDRVKYGFVLILINAFIKTAILWGLFLVIAHFILGRPLHQLVEIIGNINLDNLKQLKLEAVGNKRDEIRIIQETLNEMIQNLMKANNQIRENAQELELKNKKLEEMDRLKDEFLANTSHELRTPLHGIIGITNSLQDYLASHQLPEAQANLGIIAVSSRRLSILVDDILDFSKLKHKTLLLRRQPLDLRAVVNVAIRLSEPHMDDKPLTLKNEVSETLPSVYADEDRLQQIFHNLIGNAIKFAASGTISVQARVNEQLMEVSVSDEGDPIQAERMEAIFRPFEQTDGSLSRKYEGTGLGLAITKQLVELHDGTIQVQSHQATGNTFTFTIPITEDRPVPLNNPIRRVSFFTSAHAVTPLKKNRPHKGKFKILVVDDDVTNLQVVLNYLSVHNHEIICWQSGPEALKWIADNGKPDLILLDIMMPQMSGFEVCKILRKQYSLTHLPIIFLTASHRSVDRETGFSLGANDYLIKPFEKSNLQSRVHVHLQVLMAKERHHAASQSAYFAFQLRFVFQR